MSTFRSSYKLKASSVTLGIALGIIGLGIVLRIAQYSTNRSLAMDEALISLNIVNRSFVELTQPLSYNQGAPIGFLFSQKLAIQILGNNEYALRLFPLAAGIIALLVMYRVANSLLGTAGMLVATGLFAICGRLVYYASETKQYSSDTLIALILLLVAYKCLEAEPHPKHYITLMMSGIVSMWFSHPALFVLVGVGASLACDQLLKPDQRRLPWLGITFLAWMINLGVLYFVTLRSLAANSILIDYWRASFMPMSLWQTPAWLLNAFLALFQNPVGLGDPSAAMLGMVVFVGGGVSLMFRDWRRALVLLTPFPVTLLASYFEKYPFGDRLLLFLVAIVLLLIGEGVERVRSLVSKVNAQAAFGICLGLVAFLLYSPGSVAAQNFLHPSLGEHIRPAISYIKEHKIDADKIYVYYGALPAFSYYTSVYGFKQTEYYVGIAARQEPAKYLADLDTISVYGRVWFIFSHTCNWCTVDEEPYFLKHLDKIAKRIDTFQYSGASAYLYSFDHAQH